MLEALPPVSTPAFPALLECALDRLTTHFAGEDPHVPPKMRAQHAEILELGREVLGSLDAGQHDDAARIALRFLALARHNMIEEERDVFPYYHQE